MCSGVYFTCENVRLFRMKTVPNRICPESTSESAKPKDHLVASGVFYYTAFNADLESVKHSRALASFPSDRCIRLRYQLPLSAPNVTGSTYGMTNAFVMLLANRSIS